MVRSKEVPKKPKDPLLTPPSKPRGFSFRDDGGGSLPRNRGGVAMSSPAPASVPNYMRGTSSSGAKAGQRQRAGAPSSASASTPTRQRRPVRVTPRGKVLFPAPAAAASPGMVRPTCSSTLKEAKFPGALDLAPGATDAEGPAAMRVCPYTYCSLNGHAHAPAVPLRSFLATQRRLIKTQQSMKHKGVSAFRKGHHRPEDKNSGGAVVRAGAVPKVAPPLVDEEALGDFFVEVYTGPRVSSGTSCSDMSLDEMDATVRRMEFVVFDQCGAEDDDEKGNDLGVHDDGAGEERSGVCRESSSECSDAGISGNLVEELPWMRYECDSLDDDVSEEHGMIHEEIGEAEVLAEEQEGKDEESTSGGFGGERQEEDGEEQKPEGEEIISDLPREMGIVAEEEGVDCRVDRMYQQEASTGQETDHPGDDEECVSDVTHKMEITGEQECTICPVEVCKEQEEDADNMLGSVCQGDTCDGQGTSEEKLSYSVCEPEIPDTGVAKRVENVLEDSCKEENSADQETKDDETTIDSAGQLEIAEKQEDGESEMDIAETVPEVACEEDFFEQEAITEAVSEGEISDYSAVGSPDVEILNQPTNGGFEQDVISAEDAFEQLETNVENTVSGTEDAQKRLEITTCKSEDASEEPGITQEGEISDYSAVGSPDVEILNQPTNGGFEQDVNSAEDAFEQFDTTAENTVSGTEDAQKGLDIITCKSEDASEESGITQESSQEAQDFNSICVDAPAQMEPEITERKPENSSEEFSIPQESSQSDKSAHVNNGAQIEVCVDAPAKMEPEITECKLEDFSSEESGIPQEIGQSGQSAHVNNGAEKEPEFATCKSNDSCNESGIAQETVHGDNSAYLSEAAQVQLGNVTSELEDTSEDSGIAQEIGQDDSFAYVSDDAQNGSEISTCGLDDPSKSVTLQEAGQDHTCADVSGGSQTESELTPSELINASEGSDVTQEAVLDDTAADINDGPKKEVETMAGETEHAHEELDITQEGDKDDCAAGVCAGALKETQTSTCKTKDACEEVCVPEEANPLSIAQIPEHSYDLSTTDGHGESQNLPAEDNDAKEFSVDDMCNVFSGMNLKGDVYVDPTESEISPRKRLIIAGRRRTPEEEEHMRGFNPRGPNFLPLELDPDSEKVDLKHQTAEDRKNAEEWMIDYALRRAVNNLGGRKKKVELLVQAFETVLPHDEDQKKSTPTRPVQACN